MSVNDNGGPAFPTDEGRASRGVTPGMTLRDYFAAKAMRQQPLFPRSLWQAIRWIFGLSYRPANFDIQLDAKQSYKIADAMLEARK